MGTETFLRPDGRENMKWHSISLSNELRLMMERSVTGGHLPAPQDGVLSRIDRPPLGSQVSSL